MPASKILVEIVEPVAYSRQATAQVDVHFLVPQIQEQIVEVIEVILQEQCQRMCLFTFERCFLGLWFACKGTSDSTGGRAHNPQEQNVEV